MKSPIERKVSTTPDLTSRTPKQTNTAVTYGSIPSTIESLTECDIPRARTTSQTIAHHVRPMLNRSHGAGRCATLVARSDGLRLTDPPNSQNTNRSTPSRGSADRRSRWGLTGSFDYNPAQPGIRRKLLIHYDRAPPWALETRDVCVFRERYSARACLRGQSARILVIMTHSARK